MARTLVKSTYKRNGKPMSEQETAARREYARNKWLSMTPDEKQAKRDRVNARLHALPPEQRYEQQRVKRAERRQRVLQHYGGCCFCCGEARIQFLAIDHINGHGCEHRRSLKLQGSNIYKWLERNGYPEGYRVACHNCNGSLGHYGFCPHTDTAPPAGWVHHRPKTTTTAKDRKAA